TFTGAISSGTGRSSATPATTRAAARRRRRSGCRASPMSSRKRSAKPRRSAPKPLLFVNAAQIVCGSGRVGPRRGTEMNALDVRTDVAVLVSDDTIREVGAQRDLRRRHRAVKTIDCERGVLMPALVDSHTHAVFGAPRATEHERRAAG